MDKEFVTEKIIQNLQKNINKKLNSKNIKQKVSYYKLEENEQKDEKYHKKNIQKEKTTCQNCKSYIQEDRFDNKLNTLRTKTTISPDRMKRDRYRQGDESEHLRQTLPTGLGENKNQFTNFFNDLKKYRIYIEEENENF